jgi:hypothetical protein
MPMLAAVGGRPGLRRSLMSHPADVAAQHRVLVPEHQQLSGLRSVAAEHQDTTSEDAPPLEHARAMNLQPNRTDPGFALRGLDSTGLLRRSVVPFKWRPNGLTSFSGQDTVAGSPEVLVSSD